jgi:hypothetical protein
MRWSIGFPRRTACQLSGWPFAAEGPAPGQRRALMVSGVSRFAQQAPAAWRCLARRAPMMTIRIKVAGLIMATFSLAPPRVAPH